MVNCIKKLPNHKLFNAVLIYNLGNKNSLLQHQATMQNNTSSNASVIMVNTVSPKLLSALLHSANPLATSTTNTIVASSVDKILLTLVLDFPLNNFVTNISLEIKFSTSSCKMAILAYIHFITLKFQN